MIRDSSAPHETVLILKSGQADRHYWQDLWTYRELFLILAWRDFAVRYKQTMLGVAWAVIRPGLTMSVFAMLFGGVAKLPSDGNTPYPLLVFTGMLPWFLFSTILSEAASSLVLNSHLVGKVYFPRLIVPSAAIGVALADFAVALVLLFGMMLWYGFLPDQKILMLPFLTVMAILASLGPAVYMAALNVRYRDFRYLIPFILQFGLYISPVGFSSAVIPAKWRILYSLNPVTGVIDGFRWSLLGGQSKFYLPGFLLGIFVTSLFLALGIWYFRKTERTFADIL